ncbi:MAG: hypothetical protein GX565_01105 [Lentisphaerae bacterium]|nr:hypothetical protein [Lentisphaerota bacterium]
MRMKPYTVILAYPTFTLACPETYMNHVEAPDAELAIRECQDLAVEANDRLYEADDFVPLYVFAGHIDSDQIVFNTDKSRIDYRCPECGSRDVAVDAAAKWNVNRQDWELTCVQDCIACQECGYESTTGSGFEISVKKAGT